MSMRTVGMDHAPSWRKDQQQPPREHHRIGQLKELIGCHTAYHRSGCVGHGRLAVCGAGRILVHMTTFSLSAAGFGACRVLSAAALCLSLAAETAAAQRPSGGARPANAATTTPITEADLRSRIFRITDDSTMGRSRGAPEHSPRPPMLPVSSRGSGSSPRGDNGTWFRWCRSGPWRSTRHRR
jgi:hypothetical protein